MRGIRVKICGLRELEHAMSALEAGADLLGFVFAPSRRQVSPEQVARLARFLPRGRAELVGVFVDAPPDEVNETAERCGLDWVQLCGSEGPDECASVRVPVIKAFHAAPGLDLAEVGAYEQCARLILVDAFTSSQRGGSGLACDWSVAAEVAARYPTLLAGGLTPMNVGGAIERVRPWGVDVSSGVERDGAKDPALIEAFVRAAKKAGSHQKAMGEDR